MVGSKRVHRVAKLLLTQVLALVSLYLAFKVFCFSTGKECHLLSVMGASMEPGLKRGDLILTWKLGDINTGDIVLFRAPQIASPVVHRVIERLGTGALTKFLTQADLNTVNDRCLYGAGKDYLNRTDILGKVVVHIPYAGWPAIWLQEHPWLWSLVLAVALIDDLSKARERLSTEKNAALVGFLRRNFTIQVQDTPTPSCATLRKTQADSKIGAPPL